MAKGKSARRFLYSLHAWLGFHLALIMALVLATGTIATVSNEFDWLLQDDMRVSPEGEMAGWEVMERAARSYNNAHGLVSISAMPVSSLAADHFAFRARMVDEFGAQYFLHINQWTGEVTGTTHPLTVQRIFRDLHRRLFLPNIYALPLITSLSFILAVSLYTGLMTSRNWRVLATRIRFKKGVRIAVGDAHKAMGIWSIWFFIVIIVTSVWYLAEYVGFRAAGERFDPPGFSVSQERAEEFGDYIPDADAGRLIASAKATFPGFVPTTIRFARRARQAVVVEGRAGNILERERANAVFLDPVSAEVVAVRRAAEIGWVAWLNQIADPLHFGYLGGLPTKLIWFVFGLAMTALSVSGVWLSYRRLKLRSLSIAQFATVPLLGAMAASSMSWYETYQGPSRPYEERSLPAQMESGIESQLYWGIDETGERDGTIRLMITSVNGRANIAKVTFDFHGGLPNITVPIRDLATSIPVRERLAQEVISPIDQITTSIELNSGKQIVAFWCLEMAC